MQNEIPNSAWESPEKTDKSVKPRLETVREKKLIGKRLEMTFSDNKTAELWKSFMQKRKTITNAISSELISMQVYDRSFDFEKFNSTAPFEKWAAVEVHDFESVPGDMETYIVPGGLYAVFLHKGPASAGERTFRYIFETWLPDSEYSLDNRPHFEILGQKYKHESPDSEEEVWIPIKLKV